MARRCRARHTARASPSGRWPFTYAEIKEAFTQAMLQLNLTDPWLYRLRHGGASHARLQGRPLSEMKKQGRWTSDLSLRRYEKAVLLQVIEQEASPCQLRRVRLLLTGRRFQDLLTRR